LLGPLTVIFSGTASEVLPADWFNLSGNEKLCCSSKNQTSCVSSKTIACCCAKRSCFSTVARNCSIFNVSCQR